MAKVSYSDIRQQGFNTRSLKNGNIIFFNRKEKSNKDSQPSAQSTKLCGLGVDWCSTSDEVLALIDKLKNSNPIYFDLYMIMYYSGCRVSEVLNLTPSNIISKNQIVIMASKNSANRIVTIPLVDLRKYFSWCSENDKLFQLDRFKVYRYSVSIGLSNIGNGLFKDKPTKLFRYCHASLIYSKTKDLNLVGSALGHKVVENAKFYIYQFKE